MGIYFIVPAALACNQALLPLLYLSLQDRACLACHKPRRGGNNSHRLLHLSLWLDYSHSERVGIDQDGSN